MTDFSNLIKTDELRRTIKEVGRSWTGNHPLDDREVKEIFAIARQIEKRMSSDTRPLAPNELSAAALHEYFSS